MKKKKLGVTSTEAAALLMSDGRTSDPEEAALLAQGSILDMDALQRSALRNMMGFDFRIKPAPNKYHVSSTKPPYVTTWCKYTGIEDEAFIDRLVDACLRLKIKHDKANQ